MQNSPTTPCCCAELTPSADENRRGFLRKSAALVCGGIALLIPAAAGVVAFLNPLRQKSSGGQFMRLAILDVLPEDGTPRKVSVIADRTDAWNRYPAEPIGAVFLRRVGDGVAALQVICPHAGCSISLEGSGSDGKFSCPCHEASFNLKGERTEANSISPRNMDALDVQIRNKNEVWVKYQTFGLGTAKKVAQG